MRKTKTIKIDDKEILIKELRVKDVLELMETSEGQEKSWTDLIKEFLPRVTNLTIDELTAMAPSEIQQIYDAFKEVNAAFFEMARAVGMDAALTELKTGIQKQLAGIVADSWKQGTTVH